MYFLLFCGEHDTEGGQLSEYDTAARSRGLQTTRGDFISNLVVEHTFPGQNLGKQKSVIGKNSRGD